MRPLDQSLEISGSAEENNAANEVHDWWQHYNLLSLDGGGIRGLWTLFALERLFYFIAEKEEEDDETYTSFCPEEWPENVYQAPLTAQEENEVRAAYDSKIRTRRLPRNRKYLPCHYFDQICGSSTGGLIAIMLGRFRMTIPDCIFEYQTLAQEVFGKPRHISTLRFGLGVRAKYKAERLERVFRDVTKRRTEQPEPGEMSRITFAYGRGLCATFVTTMKKGADSGATPYLHLIRSYDHYKRSSPHPSTRPTPSSTGRTNTNGSLVTNKKPRKARSNLHVNYGPASQLEVWEVARAATAAKFYFEPLQIENSSDQGSMTFTDAGIGLANNPTQIGKQEIEKLHGSTSVGIVVSVGTARKLRENAKKASFWSSIPKSAREFANGASDPEAVHNDMQKDDEKNLNNEFSYYRLNYPGGLQCELDEWKPKRRMYYKKDRGWETMEAIKTAFNDWAQEPDNVEQLKECAAALVKCRRGRMNTSKWERYATGSHYECQTKGCDPGDIFERLQFEGHLREKHGFGDERLKKELSECRKHWRYQAAPSKH